MMHRNARVVLDDGYDIPAISFGAPVSAAGEVVFSTGMVGYPESLTDPSYRGQILTLTFPSVGNYGVPADVPGPEGLPKYFESDRVQVAGLIVADYHPAYSHWEATRALGDWLAAAGIPAVHGVDTRALTRRLRFSGTMPGKIIIDGEPARFDPAEHDLVAEVGLGRRDPIGPADGLHVVVVDCGVKANILRSLVHRGVRCTIIPWDRDPTEIECDGIMLTNGPGDPGRCVPTIEHVRAALARDVPIFGICHGCQILGLAAGGTSFKLHFGHRGQNQPVIDTETRRCYVTSQNHGYALDARELPSDFAVWFLNANDGSVEGIKHRHKPFSAVQFHPEAACGPVDTGYLFDRFLAQMAERRKGK